MTKKDENLEAIEFLELFLNVVKDMRFYERWSGLLLISLFPKLCAKRLQKAKEKYVRQTAYKKGKDALDRVRSR